MRYVIAVMLVGTMGSVGAAAPTVDGTVDPEYGAPLAVQSVQTQFGDAMPPGNLAGSELDAAYARISGGRLYIMLTGNHEPNFNKLDIFIDSRAGGENTLSGTPDYDFNPGGGWISSNFDGLTFDTGFTPDYHLFSRWGDPTGPYIADFIDRQGGGSAMVPGSTGQTPPAAGLIASGSIMPGAGGIGPNASGPALSQALDFAINDNNDAGVMGGTGAANQAAAAAVTTGMEFSIALADLGNPGLGETIRIAAMINNGDHNFLSNQVLGGLPAGTGNLGGDGMGGFTGTLGGVDFNNFAGNQYFEIRVPGPPVPAVAGVAGGVLGARRRRKAAR